jgi:hypothetical protein
VESSEQPHATVSEPNTARHCAGILRLIAILLVFSGVLVAAMPVPVAAQTDAVFSGMSADAEFGQSLSFEVTVESAATIEEAELYWYADGDVELSAAYPEIEPGNQVEIDHEVDLAFQYLPPVFGERRVR